MSTEEPLVSVVINNFNYGRFLRQAIDSAVNQTYPYKEVIVVDDGSTDDSRQIIASYGARIVPVLKENGGQASAINAGLDCCKGELIFLLDADDVWSVEKLERIAKLAREFPEAAFLYHRYQPVDANLRRLGKIRPAAVFRGWADKEVRRSGGWWACPPTSAFCFRKGALRQIGQVPEKTFRVCADAYLSSLVPFLGPVVGTADCLALYRLHDSNHFSSLATLAGKSQHEALLPQLRRYEAIVESVNQRLSELGLPVQLDLRDHLGYQIGKYRLRSAKHLSLFELVFRILCFAGEPARINRLKVLARFCAEA